jgi:DNA-binding transcriptional regulator YbjK
VPRTIDQQQRRTEIAEAVWRLIMREGVGAVSLRTVAAEAGIVLGSLRHSFPAKDDLLAYSMELVHARATERVRSHLGVREPRALVRAMLSEVMPLDPERMAEMRVNLALIVESPAYPRLADLAVVAQQAVGGLCLEACRHLRDTGLLHPARDVRVEGERLHALLDGMALHLVVEPAGADHALSAMDRHLDELAGPPDGPRAA